MPIRSEAGDDRLNRPIPRIIAAEPVIHGVLKVVWDDGYEGVVDLRPTIARGRVFAYLQRPENFAKVRVGDHGHCIAWIDHDGDEIDFAADTLRTRAENQAKLNEVAAALQT